MRIEAIEGKVRSEPLNRNFSYVESKAHEALKQAEKVIVVSEEEPEDARIWFEVVE